MDKNVAAAHFVQKAALGGIVDETGIIPGNLASAAQHQPQGEMLDTKEAPPSKPNSSPATCACKIGKPRGAAISII